jgi:23S rRNA (cytidine1920-2'-O)/16S rRNA (cytidine1409-2'-O)-methyltransferase
VIRLKGDDIPYVGRGGLKLEAALSHFEVSADNLVCLDVGASTGGFTDCLLQQGARRVYAVDVGYGQLAWKLRQDSRVVVIERTNIRHMAPDIVPQPVDLVTIDVSFISLRIVVPSVLRFMKTGACILSLIKPQFEVGKGHVGKGGLVKDPLLHAKVISDLSNFFSQLNLRVESAISSPIRGAKGNKEFLICLKMI